MDKIELNVIERKIDTLYRIKIELHPLLDEGYITKFNYFTIIYFVFKEIDHEYKNNIFNAYQTVFSLNQKDADILLNQKSDQNISNILVNMVQNKRLLNSWGIYHRDYSCLLLSEIMFIGEMIGQRIEESIVFQTVVRLLEVSPRQVEKIKAFLRAWFSGEYLKARKMLQDKNLMDLNYYNNMILEDEVFLNINSPKILIIATMSAGKSTFLNSLIDQHLFPSGNKACTSKIYSYTVNPLYKRCIAKAEGENPKINWIVNGNDIKEWNGIPTIEKVLIEGKTGPNSLLKRKLSLIDTPGANNSLDEDHGVTTNQFLEMDDYSHVFYVLNATNLAIDDDLQLLQKTLKETDGKPVIFILNKMDQLDIEADDSIIDTIKIAKEYLQDGGISSPLIFPVSAYAANLFKRVLKNEDLSKREERQFIHMLNTFSDPNYDLSSYSIIPFKDEWIEDVEDVTLQYRGIGYNRKDIYRALWYTGILSIETYVNRLTEIKVGG